MSDKEIVAMTLPLISKKKLNQKRKEVEEEEGMVFVDRWMFGDPVENSRKFFVRVDEFRFYKKNNKTVFQQCYQNPHSEVVWKEINVYLVKEEKNERISETQ